MVLVRHSSSGSSSFTPPPKPQLLLTASVPQMSVCLGAPDGAAHHAGVKGQSSRWARLHRKQKLSLNEQRIFYLEMMKGWTFLSPSVVWVMFLLSMMMIIVIIIIIISCCFFYSAAFHVSVKPLVSWMNPPVTPFIEQFEGFIQATSVGLQRDKNSFTLTWTWSFFCHQSFLRMKT